MNYKETLDFLFSQLPMYQRVGKVAYKANLNNTIALDNYFENPHKTYKIIHVAGTNGKGSVSHMIASVLQEQGYKVGLYTSPHLKDFRERIKINGKCIEEEEVIDFVKKNNKIISEVNPSFFEMTVAMAFDYFKKKNIDIAVVEVGLGGRLDSTNIVNPICSVITNISFDHQALLGDTLKKISTEKAGIIKENTPVIIGESNKEINDVFINLADKKNSKLIWAEKQFNHINSEIINAKSQRICFLNNENKEITVNLDLLGNYQYKNVRTALTAFKQLNEINLQIHHSSIINGLMNVVKNTGLHGRWEILNNNPLTICDTGHNFAGIKEIVEQLNQYHNDLLIVWGMVNDKDITKVLSLLPRKAKYFFAKPNIPRGLDAKTLQQQASKFGLTGDCYSSVNDAIKNAEKKSTDNSLIFIGGSNFVVAEIK